VRRRGAGDAAAGRMDGLLAALRAAAESTRLRIVALLTAGELTVSELARILGHSQPRISRHLKLLVEAGLLVRLREGSWVFHRLAEDGPAVALVLSLTGLLQANSDPVLARDRDRLAEVKHARAQAAADYFRRNAGSWDRLRSLHVDDGEVEQVISRVLPKRGIEYLLDIGTGTGRMLELMGPRAERGLGIDLSREMLAIARAHLDRAGLAHCRVRQADLYQLPFADGSFDVATIHQVLHFLDQPTAAIAEAGRVLAPGGNLLIADFAPHHEESLRDEHAHRRLGFTDAEIGAWLVRAGLTLVDTVHLAGDPLTVVVWTAAKPRAKARAS
jgi:ubiquinone/menaquinone biosynthesis C-methylase UbiE/DNA-binding transcriptional ArsR family regulator